MDNRLDPSLHSRPTQSDASRLDVARDANPSATDPGSPETVAEYEILGEYLGRWTQLISTTNWEKGKIIHEWRERLIEAGAAASSYSDEVWSERAGAVSPQHVGRLRRVHERFGSSHSTFAGLYWSHFLAAIDWDDAEMWLEGAVQSGWSVSHMRRTRWNANGEQPEDNPASNPLVTSDSDEDFTPLAEVQDDATSSRGDGPRNVSEGPRYDDPDFGDEDPIGSVSLDDDDDDLPWDAKAKQSPELDSPFAQLPSLPVDLAEAVEQFKLAIIRHRADSWAEVSQRDVELSLNALVAFLKQ